jgi:2-methylcitrate dehydratase PrpD
MATTTVPASAASVDGVDDELVTRRLARFVHRSRWSGLPAAVQHEAVRAFVNWVGCAYGGSFHPAVERALPALAGLSSSGACTVIGRSIRLDPLSASLLNGLSVGANAFDDAHVQTVIHPAAPTVSALLAYAEEHPVSGSEFLHALILSHELQCRLSCALAVAPARCHTGHYMTGLIGPIGVAAGVGKLMSLSEQQLVWAMGIAAMQGGGVRSAHATMSSAFIPGNAGRNGLLAAHLAAGNFTCQDEPLMTSNGLLQVIGDPPNPRALTGGLGYHWECMNVAIKPFPNGCLIHAATDVCLKLVHAHRFAVEDVERVEIWAHKLSLELTGRKEPRSADEAQGSLYHWAAAALVRGHAGLSEASEASVHDPAIISLRSRVVASADDDLQPDEARASVVLNDGRRLEAEVRPHMGAAQRPLSDDQVEAKFLGQAEAPLGNVRARQLAALCWNLPQASDVGRGAPGFWGAQGENPHHAS